MEEGFLKCAYAYNHKKYEDSHNNFPSCDIMIPFSRPTDQIDSQYASVLNKQIKKGKISKWRHFRILLETLLLILYIPIRVSNTCGSRMKKMLTAPGNRRHVRKSTHLSPKPTKGMLKYRTITSKFQMQPKFTASLKYNP